MKCGRGAAGKAPVFGLLKRDEKVLVVIIPTTSTISGTERNVFRDVSRVFPETPPSLHLGMYAVLQSQTNGKDNQKFLTSFKLEIM